jgi:hypothetical protein
MPEVFQAMDFLDNASALYLLAIRHQAAFQRRSQVVKLAIEVRREILLDFFSPAMGVNMFNPIVEKALDGRPDVRQRPEVLSISDRTLKLAVGGVNDRSLAIPPVSRLDYLAPHA